MPRFINSLGTCRFMLACLAFCFCCTAAGAAEKNSYTLAVIPNLPAVTLHKNWTPFVEQLSQKLGVTIELKMYDKLATFIEDAKNGQPDFIYTSPNLFYVVHQKQKYIPLIRSSNMFRGQVFVRKDSPYTKLSDLRGKSIAFVGPKTVCSVITRQALLSNLGDLDFITAYNGTTANVAKSVQLGKVDAGAALDTSLLSEMPEVSKEFRSLLETEKIASHPLAAHPRIPKKLQNAVAEAVLAMATSDKGQKTLEIVKLAKPVPADYKRDYSLFAEFDFERLEK